MHSNEDERSRPRRGAHRARAAAATAIVGALLLSGCWSSSQSKVLTLVNDTRKAARKPALTGNQAAMDKAQRWAQHMADTGVVQHTGGGSAIDPAGLPKWCAVGENVARGTSTESIFNEWMHSTIHKSNILGSFDRAGTGVVRKGDQVFAVLIVYRSC